MSRRVLHPLLFIAFLGGLWALTHSVEGVDAGWLSMLPAFVLALPLLAGRYLGADRIVRWARSLDRRAVRPARRLAPSHPVDVVRLRSGLLLALRLGERAPPHAALQG